MIPIVGLIFIVGGWALVAAIADIDDAYRYQQRTREGIGYLHVGTRLLAANVLLVWSARSLIRIAAGVSSVVLQRAIQLAAGASIVAVAVTDVVVVVLTA